jgi:hypothetical protein
MSPPTHLHHINVFPYWPVSIYFIPLLQFWFIIDKYFERQTTVYIRLMILVFKKGHVSPLIRDTLKNKTIYRYLQNFLLVLSFLVNIILMFHFICFTTYLDNVSLNYTQRDRTIFCSFCLPSLFKLSFKKNQHNYNIYDRNLNISD